VFRDEQFADDVDESPSSGRGGGGVGSSSDRRHFDEILTGYRLILTGKRVDPVDIRVKTGWWADSTGTAGTSSCGSAGKVRTEESCQHRYSDSSLSFRMGSNSTLPFPCNQLPYSAPIHYFPLKPPFLFPYPHLYPPVISIPPSFFLMPLLKPIDLYGLRLCLYSAGARV